MSKLRMAMQSAAIVNPDPNLMLRVADATLRLSHPDTFATAIAAVYDPATRIVTFASAGHPGPALRTADGRVEEFRHAGAMIGLRTRDPNPPAAFPAPPGSTLVFYTDGLLEVVRDVDEGFRRLSGALREDAVVRAERPAEALVEAVLGKDEARDDIAVLVVNFESSVV